MTQHTIDHEAIAWPDEALALLRQATRIETSMTGGSVVWHVWGSRGPRAAAAHHAPLVLLHGGSGSWMHWLKNIPALVAAGRWVLVPDLPGFGDSSAPVSGMDADVLPEPIEAGLAQLLGPLACELVGFSFGGMVAGFIAHRFPARVKRLVLVGAPGMGIDPVQPVQLRGWRHLDDPLARDAIHRGNLAALMLYREASITELAVRVQSANVVRDRMMRRSLARTDVLARSLQAVRCPVHAIYGQEDVLYRGRADALQSALAQAPDFRGLQWIADAGHWVQFERPVLFDGALCNALQADA